MSMCRDDLQSVATTSRSAGDDAAGVSGVAAASAVLALATPPADERPCRLALRALSASLVALAR
jgi:hypothetical protein